MSFSAYAGVSDELSSQLAESVTCHIESSAAMLRLSSQETQDDSSWIMVSQDAAAKANTTLASPKRSNADEQTARERLDSAGEEVELFSRPRTAGDSISSMVSGATDKFVSYVGSYTHLLTKSFSAVQTQEQIPLVPIPERCQSEASGEVSGSDASKFGSSIDDSPHTPSFHTPMATPSEDRGFGGAGTSATLEDAQVNATQLPRDTEKQGEMIEISLEEEVPDFVAGEAGVAQKPTDGVLSMNEAVTSATGMSPHVLPGDQTSLDSYSLLQSHLPSDANKDGHDDLPLLCNDNQAFSTDDQKEREERSLGPRSYMPSLPHDKAELLQYELDSSAASCTPSTTLPSSLLSTPSDDLDSYEILGSAQLGARQPDASLSENTDNGSGNTDLAKLSDSSPSLPYMSPAAEPQAAGEGCPSRGIEDIKMKDDVEMESKDADMEEDGEPREEDVEIKNVADDIAATSSLISGSSVDLGNPQHPLPKPSSPVDAVCPKPFPDPLLSPDSGCLSDEADKMESSAATPLATASVLSGGGASKPSLSRDGLHLNLHRTTSSGSSTSLPRSASQPMLRDPSAYRSHSMSPSDFKRERHSAQSPLRAIRNIPIVKNPYMSPLLAPDWLLEGLPHVCLVVSQFIFTFNPLQHFTGGSNARRRAPPPPNYPVSNRVYKIIPKFVFCIPAVDSVTVYEENLVNTLVGSLLTSACLQHAASLLVAADVTVGGILQI